jgi:hypothetical protein
LESILEDSKLSGVLGASSWVVWIHEKLQLNDTFLSQRLALMSIWQHFYVIMWVIFQNLKSQWISYIIWKSEKISKVFCGLWKFETGFKYSPGSNQETSGSEICMLPPPLVHILVFSSWNEDLYLDFELKQSNPVLEAIDYLEYLSYPTVLEHVTLNPLHHLIQLDFAMYYVVLSID